MWLNLIFNVNMRFEEFFLIWVINVLNIFCYENVLVVLFVDIYKFVWFFGYDSFLLFDVQS